MEYSDFIPPLSDFGFKNIFGKKENLIVLLNAILHQKLHYEEIVDVKFSPTENKAENPGRKSTFFDIHCTTTGGHRIIVEMQNAWEQNFDNRMLYYAAEAIMRQDGRIAPNHPWDYTIDPVIGLAICNFTMPRFAHERIAFFNLRDEITGQRYGNQLGLVFVHLPEFSNEVEECVTDLDMIVYSLKNMEEIQKMGRVPFSQGEGDFYSRIAMMSRVSALSPDERLEYDRWRKAENDRMLAEQRLVKRTLEEGMAKGIQQGMAKGIQQGMAQGMAKGERKNSLHVANKLIKMGGFTPEQISEISNLSIDEVTQLLNQSN